MTTDDPGSGPQRDPGLPRYEIHVRGHLGETIRSAFPALDAEPHGSETLFRGRLADQAALFGVLAEIETLGLELLEIRQLRPGAHAWIPAAAVRRSPGRSAPSLSTPE